MCVVLEDYTRSNSFVYLCYLSFSNYVPRYSMRVVSYASFFSFETVKHIIIIPFWISEHLISIKGQNNLANHIRIFYLPFYMIFSLIRNTDLDTDPVVPTQYFSIPLVNQSTFGKIDSRFIHFVRRDQ